MRSRREWSKLNPVLRLGQMAEESDTGRVKFGDGVTRWKELSHFVPNAPNDGILHLELQAPDTSIVLAPSFRGKIISFVIENIEEWDIDSEWKVVMSSRTELDLESGNYLSDMPANQIVNNSDDGKELWNTSDLILCIASGNDYRQYDGSPPTVGRTKIALSLLSMSES